MRVRPSFDKWRPGAGRVSGGFAGILLLSAVFTGLQCAPDTLPPDILLITLDTARADRFSFHDETSPVETRELDALAAEGTVFLGAVSPSPVTLPAHASLLTGLYPTRHGVRNNGVHRLPDRHETLAERLRSRGYATGAFVAASVLDSQFGLAQGFDVYDDEIGVASGGMFSVGRRPGEVVVSHALQWLETQDRGPVFLWVHLYDPHAPYLPPEPERGRYPGRPYDGVIAYCDRIVGELLIGFKKLRSWEKTAVVLTADHGESLGAHGEDTHGIFIYDATLRIPLVIKGPRVPSGYKAPALASLVDVYPTVLDMLGLSTPEGIDGQSLLDVATRMDGGHREVAYVESLRPYLSFGWAPLRGLRTHQWKYIQGVEPELYDLTRDPHEEVDIAGDNPEQVGRFRAVLAEQYPETPLEQSESLELDEQTIRELESLGYLGLRSRSPGSTVSSQVDPRERIAMFKRLDEALALYSSGRQEEALERLGVLRREDPGNPYLAQRWVELLLISGRWQQAALAAVEAVEDFPDDLHFLELQARALESQGQVAEALSIYEGLMHGGHETAAARAHRWSLLERLGERDRLMEELQRITLEDPSDGEAMATLLRLEYIDQSEERLQQGLAVALEANPDNPFLSAELARSYLRVSDIDRAEEYFSKVLDSLPGHHDAALVVGRIANSRGDFAKARQVLEVGVLRFPDKPAMWLAYGEALIGLNDGQGAEQAIAHARNLGAPTERVEPLIHAAAARRRSSSRTAPPRE